LTAEESRIDLARYRLKQAEESIDEAAFLLQGKKSPRAVINRAYYGMFYAVLALLIFEPYASSKHSGVLGYFNRRFVKQGIFPEEMGRVINKAFDLRQRGDYREYEDLSYALVEPFVDQSRIFLQGVKDYLEKGVFSQSP
jgi:uncharacterized protein (UPF0332 family)